MCLICERIKMIQEGTNPYFVKELSTGYVVMGDHQHFTGYTLFLCKEHKTELFQLEHSVKLKFIYLILRNPCVFKENRHFNVRSLCIFPCFCPYEPKQGKLFV